MDHEVAFAEEAREEIQDQESQQRRRPQKGHVRITTAEDASDHENEGSPLIGSPESSGHRGQHKRGHSYQKAINEPWTGAHRQGDRPWHKKPSVRYERRVQTPETVSNWATGVLAPPSILPLLYCIWGDNCTENLPDTRLDMSRSTVRSIDERP